MRNGRAIELSSKTSGFMKYVALTPRCVPLTPRCVPHAQKVAIQADGKIVVMGQSYSSTFTNQAATVARYNADGTLDTTFGSPNGYVTDTRMNDPLAMALQSGKVVVAGGAIVGPIYQFAMLRFGTDGVADSTFGTPDGYVLTTIGTSPYPYATAIDGNGKIVVAGGQGSGTAAYFVVRYLP
ncbi:MAG: hypothetical protein CXR30_05700 [Geobacter sp.]|nr:MAG: hypothetical protein CXR30_05700 [Geobacter sp.]